MKDGHIVLEQTKGQGVALGRWKIYNVVAAVVDVGFNGGLQMGVGTRIMAIN